MTSDETTLPELVSRVRDMFPRLVFAKAELNDYGEDNVVLVLDREWIVRAPRTPEYLWRFAAELSLLEALRPVSPVAVPRYEFVAPDRSMGAYRMIPGTELTPPVFALLEPRAQRSALIALGDFLSVLHGFPEETIRQPDGMIQRRWSGEQYAARYRGMRRAKIARVTPEAMLKRFDAFHAALETQESPVSRLVHDDLTEDHILVRADGALGGIIDFSDARSAIPRPTSPGSGAWARRTSIWCSRITAGPTRGSRCGRGGIMCGS
ncbi:MAG: phosphotransferase [Rhizomicrobium sp.]